MRINKSIFSMFLVWVGFPFLFWGGILFCISSCVFSHKEKKTEEAPTVEYTFTLPDVPVTLTDPEDRANYAALHYWDHFDFADTAYVHLPEVTEQAFADFLNILPYTEYGNAVEAINGVLTHAEKEPSGRMYRHFIGLFIKYLHDPNSPYRNDEYYIPVTEYILQDSINDELERSRSKYHLESMLKNRIGTVSGDITYTLADGNTGRLHAIRADYTILYFNNPDCNACEETADALKGSAVINSLLESGELAILAFYPDEDIDIWKDHLSHIPDRWINGYDRETKVESEEIYDLRAIPSLYLLDREKRVLLKDADFIRLESWLADRFPLLTSN